MISYKEVLEHIGGATAHLLLGNGFSIACDSIFSYDNLYNKAVEQGLSDRAKEIFEKIGTNNFEAVMRLLDDGNWLGGVYQVLDPEKSDMKGDLNVLKNTLIKIISTSHIPHPGEIDDSRKKRASNFFLHTKIFFV